MARLAVVLVEARATDWTIVRHRWADLPASGGVPQPQSLVYQPVDEVTSA